MNRHQAQRTSKPWSTRGVDAVHAGVVGKAAARSVNRAPVAVMEMVIEPCLADLRLDAERPRLTS